MDDDERIREGILDHGRKDAREKGVQLCVLVLVRACV